ncbi:MAG: hypothetical protein V1775_10640 [Bacteroidota bacterium]
MKKHPSLFVIISILIILFQRIDTSDAQNWEATNGPYGGPIQCFTENSSYIFAGSTPGIYAKGIFRSADHGASWTTVNSGLSSAPMGQDIAALAVSGSNVIASTQVGIYYSSNNGDSWSVSSYTGSYIPNAFCIVGAQLLAGGSSGLYVSDDNGLTWAPQNDNFQGITAPAVPQIKSFVIDGSYIYAGTTGKGIFRSADNGLTWTTVNTGLGTTTQLNSRTFGNLGTNGTDVFAGTSGQGVFRLINNGNTWTQEITGLPTGQARSVSSMLIKDTYIYITTNVGIYRSNNSGTIAWSLQNVSPAGLTFGKLLLSGSDIFAATNKGVQISTDNTASWTASQQGMLGLVVTGISSAGGTDLFASTLSGVMPGFFFRSNDFGDTWVMGNLAGDPFLFNNYLFIYQLDGWIYRSSDNGATWQQLYETGTLTSFYSMGTTLFARITCCDFIFYSNDNGETWIPSTYTGSSGGFSSFLSMTNDGTNLFAGTGLSGVLKSMDYGLNWTSLSAPWGDLPIRAVTTNGTFLFAGTSNSMIDPGILATGIYRSADNGITWQQVNSGLGNLDIYSLMYNGTDLYAGTKGGVYKSTDNGNNWAQFNQGFSIPPAVTSLAISGNYLFTNNNVPSIGGPVYRKELSGTVPGQPSAISGSSNPCINSSQIYSVTNVPGVTYAWQFPSGWVVTEGGTTSSVTVTVGNAAGIVLVTPSNGWGSGPLQFLIVAPLTCQEKTLGITLFLEGLYNGSNLMREANNETGPQFGEGIADEITVELHNAADYSVIDNSFNNIQLDTYGNAGITVPTELTGDYYITIRHRNSIETVSAAPVSFAGSTTTYAFDASEKAYGGNLLQMTDGTYVIYGGDVNQDGAVDTGDVTPVDNDQFNFISGYFPSDVNGDGTVDTGDVTIIDNNQFGFVGAVLP